MTPPGKDDEGKKTSPDTEADETDPGSGKEDGREDAPARKDPEEIASEPESDASKKRTPTEDDAGSETEDRDTDEPAKQDPVDRIGDPDLQEPAGPAEGEPKQSEPVTAVPAPPPPTPRSGGGFRTGLLGAVIGAAVAAVAVWYVLQQMPREPGPEVMAALDRQQEEIEAQADTIAALEGEVQALSEELGAADLATLRGDTETRLGSVSETLSGLAARLDTMESQLTESGGRLADLESRLGEGETRITDLEARPIADPETANQVLRSEIADMRAEVEQATEDARAQVDTMRNELSQAAAATQAEIEAAEQRAAELEAQARERAAAAEAEAQASARAAAAQAALAQIDAALDSGEPYGEALAALAANAEAEVPEALAAPAEAGVPTLGELRESYPDAARAALSASRVATSEGDPGSRVMAFLRTQTGARSLTPQEGGSPDAVLSRAEAALDEGDVTSALAELEALPEDGRAAMQDWIDSAEVRADAAAAADTLSQGMN